MLQQQFYLYNKIYFLNDDFADKCPQDLLEIINNPEKRKKLVIYINPPYAECGLVTDDGNNKAGVSSDNSQWHPENRFSVSIIYPNENNRLKGHSAYRQILAVAN